MKIVLEENKYNGPVLILERRYAFEVMEIITQL